MSLPNTTFTSGSFSLSDALKQMGMKLAFDTQLADLSGLCSHPPDGDNLYVGDVIQKAMISMQEKGVEAATATAVIGVGAAFAPAPTPVPMNVNRPYLVALIDNPTGAVLMLGHIHDPTNAGSPSGGSSSARTRCRRSSNANGFCKKAVPGPVTPWRNTASSV